MTQLKPKYGGLITDVAIVNDYYAHDNNAPDQRGAYLGKKLIYWCEACGYPKYLPVRPWAGTGDSWEWNGQLDGNLVLQPSQLHRTYQYPHPYEPETNPEHAEIKEKFEQGGGHDWMMNHRKWGRRCHTFIGINGAPPGHIIYLDDCLHSMRGVRPLLQRQHWPDRSWAQLIES